MCFHVGMTSGFVLDKGEEGERELGEEEAEEVLRGIHHEFVRVRKTDKLCSASKQKLFFPIPPLRTAGPYSMYTIGSLVTS